MRTALLPLLALSFNAVAQCPFDPTIEPADMILCPNEQGELSTQVYDTYQWYKNGELIPDETAQSLFVDQYTDAGSEFTVEVTLNGCTEMSPPVLVDGWAFLPIYTIHGGDEPHSIVNEGEAHYCPGDTLTLTIGMSDPVHITWYRNGQVLQGAEGPVLAITTTGYYTCSAAPGICPNALQYLGVEVAAIFDEEQQPTISANDAGELCASPTGTSYQWYLNGAPLAGSDAACIPVGAQGSYTVFVDQGLPCQVLSEPFLATGVGERSTVGLVVVQDPAHQRLSVQAGGRTLANGGWTIMDALGRRVLEGTLQGEGWIGTSALGTGTYLLQLDGTDLRPVRFIKP